MARAKLLLLGSPRLEYDNVPVEVDTRKAIALLAYLVVTKQRQSRDALAALLWPDYDQTRARAALRRTLSTLNSALSGTVLDVERESIGAQPDAIEVDVEQFTRRLAECWTHGHTDAEICPACIPALTDAVKLYRDDFMAGFSLRDSSSFDDWQFFQAEGLRRDLGHALERLVRAHTVANEWESAIGYARRWLALDPLHEPAHRTLMLLYAWGGTRAAALRQYRECVRMLEQELGVAPLEETTQLYEAIKENQTPPPPSREPAVPRQASGSEPTAPLPQSDQLIAADSSSPTHNPGSKLHPALPPLVGRAAEWSTLLEAYAAASDGRLIVLEGEPGIGKTRLAEEFLAHVRANGGTTITARSYAGETNLAYGPFVESMNAAMSHAAIRERLQQVPLHTLSEAARLFPALQTQYPSLPPAPPLDTPGAQARFFESISQVLLALCGSPQPGVLFLDDLHWADAASLDLFTYLVRRLRGRPLCIVVTWRSEQATTGTRLRDLLAEAQRAGIATTLQLTRLSPTAVLELIQSVAAVPVHAGNEADGELRLAGIGQRLYDETEGLPLFVREYLAAMDPGALSSDQADWSLPGGVRDLLRGRLAAVSETGAQLLTTAAAIGRSFDYDTLREASGRSEEETVTALEELIERGLVVDVGSGAGGQSLLYDFSHEKLRALVYGETSLARRRLLHRRVAESLAARTRGRRDAAGGLPGRAYGQIAHHYQEAGQEAEAAEYFKLAGEHARSLYANAEALAHFRTALALGHPEAAELHEAIGDLHTLLGEYTAAIAAYESAATRCGAPTCADVERKLGDVHQRRGEWALAEHHVQAALALLGEAGPAAERARLYADWSLIAHRREQTEQALDLARRALTLAEAAGDTRALAEAHNRLGILSSSQDDLESARQHLEQSLALAETLSDPSIRAAALNNLALVYASDGDTTHARSLAEEALKLCAALGDRHREAALHNNLADLFHAAGESEAAMAHLKQAVAIYAEIGVEAGTVQPAIWRLAEW